MMTSDLSNTPNKRQKMLRNALWYGGFWLLFTLWLRLALPESMMGWERHQLFRFSADYWTYFSSNAYPVLLHLQAFFTQFYLYPLLGAAVIGGLLVLGMGAWHRLTGRYWTGAVWAAFMLPLIPYFNLLWILIWLLLLGGGLLINLHRLPTYGRLGLMAACGIAGGLLIQENIVWGIAFWSIIGGLRTRSWRNGLYGLAAGIAGAAIGIGLIIGIGYPFYYAQFLWKWPILNGNFYIIQEFPSIFFFCPTLMLVWGYATIGIAMGLPFAARLSIRKKTWARGLTGLLIAGLLITAGWINLRYQTEEFFLVDRLAGENRWAEAADAAELAFFRHARPESAGDSRAFFLRGQRQRARTLSGKLGITPLPFQTEFEEGYMADMLKISLLASKQATEKLFAYNGSYYFPLLLSEEILHVPCSYVMALYYTQNGLYAEALHLLYDFITLHRVSTAVLTPLLWNSVVVGDYVPCRKFIRFFEQSLFHKDIARRYTAYISDTVQTALNPEIAAARTRLSTHNHTVLGYHPDDNTHFRLLSEGDNAAVYEYALALWMVYKNHNQILTELPKIRQYYKTLPTHIQEAVLACFPIERLDEVPDDINPDIKARYAAFLQTYGLYQNGYTSFRKLKKGFEDTYWYHATFNDFKTTIEPTHGQSGAL